MNPKISIILPCYNGEKFISKTINSIINQSLKNWECIVINDGSKDNSLEEIKKSTSADNRFQIVDQENKGLSVSRNIGLDLAKGDYIFFIDSDDLISITCLEKLSNCTNNEIDIVTGITATSLRHDDTIHEYLNHSIEADKIIENSNLEVIKVAIAKGITCVAQNRLYKKSFLEANTLRFKEKIYHEDELFFFETYFHAKNVFFSSETTYFYNVGNITSITKNKTAKNINDYLSITKYIYEKYYLNTTGEKKEIVALFLTNFKWLIFYHLAQCSDTEQNKIKPIIEQVFSETKIKRIKKVLSSRFEKKLFMFHVFSFESIDTIKKFLYLNSKKNIFYSLHKKILFTYYKNKNKKNINKTYSYSKLK